MALSNDFSPRLTRPPRAIMLQSHQSPSGEDNPCNPSAGNVCDVSSISHKRHIAGLITVSRAVRLSAAERQNEKDYALQAIQTSSRLDHLYDIWCYFMLPLIWR